MKYHVVTQKNEENEVVSYHVSGPSISDYKMAEFTENQAKQVAVWLNGAYINGSAKRAQKISKALGIPSGLVG